jgi:hypothetical protein
LARAIAVNPVTHLVTAVRGFMHGGLVLSDWGGVFVASRSLSRSLRRFRFGCTGASADGRNGVVVAVSRSF